MAGECLADLVRNKTFDYVAERLQGCSEEQVLQILQSRLHVSPFVAYLIYRDLRAPRHWVVSRVGLFPRVEYWLALGCFFSFLLNIPVLPVIPTGTSPSTTSIEVHWRRGSHVAP